MNMKERIFSLSGDSPALDFAAKTLTKRGLEVVDTPTSAVTHLLLDTPCRYSQDQLQQVFSPLNPQVKIFGGFLDLLQDKYRCYDLLKNEEYLARNARITAQCAIGIAQRRMNITWDGCPVLILGWGRIGKCLGLLLKGLGAEVVIAARRPGHRAMAKALGLDADGMDFPGYALGRYRVIFNTIPAPVLSSQQQAFCRPECLKIDLASQQGIQGEDVLIARGLPGKEAPESSGRLIAEMVLKLCAEKES
jgi:hypothetical protein